MRKGKSLLRSVAEAIHLFFTRLPRWLRLLAMTSSFTLLTGCNAIYNWADGVGKHLPTIGEPCEHWQCVTESGQRTSEQLKKKEEVSEKPPVIKEGVKTETPPAAPISK